MFQMRPEITSGASPRMEPRPRRAPVQSEIRQGFPDPQRMICAPIAAHASAAPFATFPFPCGAFHMYSCSLPYSSFCDARVSRNREPKCATFTSTERRVSQLRDDCWLSTQVCSPGIHEDFSVINPGPMSDWTKRSTRILKGMFHAKAPRSQRLRPGSGQHSGPPLRAIE